MKSRHLAECRIIYPRDLLKPGEALPPGVAEDIGLRVCAENCPRLAEVRAFAVGRLRKPPEPPHA